MWILFLLIRRVARRGGAGNSSITSLISPALGQMVIRLLDAVTEEAFVFRVDMRLRPYGDSGALVGAYSALEVYYQEQGREWERYAMIKARPLTGSQEARESLMAMLGSFVYRRYTDFSVIAALRDMKRMMRAEVARLGIDDDLKRGAGGIREIEFIAQSLQLIHGGRIPEIRCRSLSGDTAGADRGGPLVEPGVRLPDSALPARATRGARAAGNAG